MVYSFATKTPITNCFYTGCDFTPDVVELAIQFANNPNYRSASAAELINDNGFFRRPIRPEDMRLLDFSTPLTNETALDLGGLIANRVLLNTFECHIHEPPASCADDDVHAYQTFYAAETRQLGQAIRPLMQKYLFSYLNLNKANQSLADSNQHHERDISELIQNTFAQISQRQRHLAQIVSSTSPDNRSHSESIILIQHAGLLSAKQWAAKHALAVGILHSSWSEFNGTTPITDLTKHALLRATTERNLVTGAHRYWQFYLSSALGCSNLLYSHCYTPTHGLQALATLLLCRLHLVAFHQSFSHSLMPIDENNEGLSLFSLSTEIDHIKKILQHAASQYGRSAYDIFIGGFLQAGHQWRIFDKDLSEQLIWLSTLDQHQEIAQKIMQVVERNKDNIDLDTFFETLETCSTTHVHDEHRLVVIESGQMVFWGHPEMRLHLSPGEMILVPRNRLHGSSITTAKCIYHQPIITPAWLAENKISLVT